MLTKEEVFNISKMARISINSDEVKMFTKSLNDILEFVDMINEFDFKGKNNFNEQ